MKYVRLNLYMFTVYIDIYVLNKIHVLHVEPMSYIYIYIYLYTTSNAGFQIYIANNIYIYTIINVKCWLPEPWISNIFYLQHVEPFYERALAENTFPPLPSQLLQNFPLPRFKLSVCTSSRKKKIRNNDLLYILHHFLCFGSAALASCTLTSCFLARRSFGSCDRIFYRLVYIYIYMKK